MLNISKSIAVAALLFLPANALAQSCGSPPAAPKIVRPSALAQKSTAEIAEIQHQAFANVRDWQGAVQPYRDCLTKFVADDKQKLARADSKKDSDKIAQWKSEAARADHSFNATVDTEELMVAAFHAIQTAYCMRKDSNVSACPH